MQQNFISPILGVYLDDIDLVDIGLDIAAVQLEGLLQQHQVVIVRNQDLSAKELRQLVSHFGPLFQHHADEGVIHVDGIPEVLEMRKEAEGNRLFGGSDWHADVTFRKPAGYVSALQAKILPPLGGDTGFASALAAYQALSTGFQQMLEGLIAVHSYDGPGQADHPEQTARHAVVREHPRIGGKGIYCNKMFVTRFEGWSAAESRPVIDFLDRHMSRPEFTFRHRWQPGDLVLWDNRFSLHYPINDFSGHLRSLIRCTALEA
ncbi:MAG: taurine dioxygenase [Planctomycetota bacterium]|jgi:taurine dioxygenase